MSNRKKLLTREQVVRRARAKQGTRAAYQLASELGVHPSTVSELYNSGARPSKNILSKLGLRAVELYEDLR